MKPLRHRHRQKYLRGHLSLTTRRPGFVAQRGRTSVRSVHCTAGRRVADGGGPGGVGDLLTQGHLHPASSPGVNLTPARPLVDRPGHLSFWPACPGLNLQKEEEAKSAGSRRGPRGRRRPWIRAQHPLFLLRVFVLPSAPALARCLRISLWAPGGQKEVISGRLCSPCTADDSPGFQEPPLRGAAGVLRGSPPYPQQSSD